MLPLPLPLAPEECAPCDGGGAERAAPAPRENPEYRRLVSMLLGGNMRMSQREQDSQIKGISQLCTRNGDRRGA